MDCSAERTCTTRNALHMLGARGRTSRFRSGTRARRPAGIYAPALLHRITHACARAPGPAQHAAACGAVPYHLFNANLSPEQAHPRHGTGRTVPSPSYGRAPMPHRAPCREEEEEAGTRGDRASPAGARVIFVI